MLMGQESKCDVNPAYDIFPDLGHLRRTFLGGHLEVRLWPDPAWLIHGVCCAATTDPN
jgi:hypothetical protein